MDTFVRELVRGTVVLVALIGFTSSCAAINRAAAGDSGAATSVDLDWQ